MRSSAVLLCRRLRRSGVTRRHEDGGGSDSGAGRLEEVPSVQRTSSRSARGPSSSRPRLCRWRGSSRRRRRDRRNGHPWTGRARGRCVWRHCRSLPACVKAHAAEIARQRGLLHSALMISIRFGLPRCCWPACCSRPRRSSPAGPALFNGKDFTGWKISRPGVLQDRGRRDRRERHWPATPTTTGPFTEPHLPQFRAEGRRHDPRQLERRRLRAHRVPGERRQRPRLRRLPLEGIRDPGQQLYTRDPVQIGSLYHVQDVTERAGQRRRVVHRAHHRQGQHDHREGERQAAGDWTQPADWNGGREGPGRAITAAGGTIALQAHDPNSTVYYKNIRIKPLQ